MTKINLVRLCCFLLASLAVRGHTDAQTSAGSPISLDEYLSTSEISAARIAPDGAAAVIETSTPDWVHDRFSSDLWLWQRGTAGLRALTHSGHEGGPSWSPDGRSIAFTSDRPVPEQAAGDKATRLWVMPLGGGEAMPLYTEKLDVNTFAWSGDGNALYFAVTEQPGKEQEEALKKDWKDVKRMREQERGDMLLRMPVAPAMGVAMQIQLPPGEEPKAAPETPLLPKGATMIARSPLAIDSIVPAPDGHAVAFVTGSVSHRFEKPSDFEVYLLPSGASAPVQVTHNQGREDKLRWSKDEKQLYFRGPAAGGSVEGAYQDVQGRLYSIDVASGKLVRLGAEFGGSWEDYTVTADNRVIACGVLGLEQHMYQVEGAHARKLDGAPGTYGGVEAALHGRALLYTRSAIGEPTQVYVADDLEHVSSAPSVTAFNPIFKERSRVTWRVFEWKSEDGASVEGVLLFPPGEENTKHLKMLTLIHGGPADADGNRYGANWYDWATLAASQGWLVFRPNYRGSTGYGDAFELQIAPHLVSLPGKDVLTGVDALVQQGFADPEHLAIGGYSYGGYVTNWLITQTTRFKAAVTGAGAVEHAANWGNDDLTFDDAWYLGGRPWEQAARYTEEGALFHMDKVTTPTHIVGGDADVRVSYLEDVTQERALEALGVPHTLLTFPGEGHPLGNNPWHGYIKVRDELLWLDKYAGGAPK